MASRTLRAIITSLGNVHLDFEGPSCCGTGTITGLSGMEPGTLLYFTDFDRSYRALVVDGDSAIIEAA